MGVEAYTTGGCLWKGVSLILGNERLEHSTVIIPEPSKSSRAGKKSPHNAIANTVVSSAKQQWRALFTSEPIPFKRLL